ncbi:MAG: hypothetical protein WBE65_08825 [Steroidobacteraceae bacterium]
MNTVVTRLVAERRFYVSSAIAITLVVLAGFSVDLDLLRDMSGLSALVRLHGLVMLGWIALFVTQIVLVARARVDWHRRLGVFGALLAAVVVIADTATVIVGFRLGGKHLPPGVPAPLFVALGLFDLLSFAVLVGSAIVLRRQSPWHKRLMLLAAILLLDAALARFISVYTSWGVDAAWVRNGLVLLCVAIDSLRCRRLHPAFALGALLVFVTDPLAHWAASTTSWARFCAWLG